MSELPPAPWAAIAGPLAKKTADSSYIEICGPNGEAICTIFPNAGKGGIGIERARAVARLIVEARNEKAD